MSEQEAAANDKCHHKGRHFTIKDNILIGGLSIPRKAINAGEVILKALNSTSEYICQVDAVTSEINTNIEVSTRSVECALSLQKHGIKPGDIIGVCSDNNLNAILPLLAALYVGAICNTWDHDLSPVTARYFLSLTSPTLIFTIPSSADCLKEAANELKMNVEIVTLEELDGYQSFEDFLLDYDIEQVAEFKCATISKPEEVAFIVCSSSSTGLPKGTEISHFSIYSGLHATEVAEMVTYLFCDTYVLIRFIKNELLRKYRLPTLKTIVVTGAKFSKCYQEELAWLLPHVFIRNIYEMTDAASVCSAQTKHSKSGSIGFVSNTVQIKIADLKTGNIQGPNQSGELCIKVPSVMNGYYKNPEATKRAFDSDGWLRSGDVGYYDDDGELFFIDRISDFIIVRSNNVSSAEIEDVLEKNPAVFQAAVIGIPDEVDEQHPMAIVSGVLSKTVTKEELIDFVEKSMPDHCRLRGGVKFVNKLPYTATGKIAKNQLRKTFIN